MLWYGMMNGKQHMLPIKYRLVLAEVSLFSRDGRMVSPLDFF